MQSTGLIRVIKAMNLPKTERTSLIDGYIQVAQNGNILGRTKTKDDCEDPVWEESFPITVNRALDGKLDAIIELQLFDENTFKDKLVGHARVDLSALSYQQLPYIEIVFTFTEDKLTKQGRNSRVGVAISPGILNYPSLRSMWGGAPGALCNDAQQRLYLPFQDPSAGPLVLGIEYEKGGVADFKFIGGRSKTKIRRRTYPQGHMVAPGLTAFQEIYMSVDPGETMMLVDWDEDDVDIKRTLQLAVLASPVTSNKAYDLTINGQDSKNQSEVFMPPKAALGGKYQVGRIYELDDVKYGSSLTNIAIHRLQLSNMRTYSVQDLIRIMG